MTLIALQQNDVVLNDTCNLAETLARAR